MNRELVTWQHLLCRGTCTSSWPGQLYGRHRTDAPWVTGGHLTRRNELLRLKLAACRGIKRTIERMHRRKQLHKTIVQGRIFLLLCHFFLFEVTGINRIRVRCTGMSPTLLFAFLPLFLFLSLPLLLFRWHTVIFLCLGAAIKPVCAEK